MRLTDLESLTDNPKIAVSKELWAHAALLGAARQRRDANGKRSDRGKHNTYVDLMGAFGELLLLEQIRPLDERMEIQNYFRTHLYIESGAADQAKPDLSFTAHDDGHRIDVDVKTFDCDTKKRYFAINDGKHNALRDNCQHYFCVFARPFGRHAAIAKLVPYSHVEPAEAAFPKDKWFIGSLLTRGSPSRNLFLDTFLEEYFTEAPKIADLRKRPYSRKEILQAAQEDDCKRFLREIIPDRAVQESVSKLDEWDREMDAIEMERRNKEHARRVNKKRMITSG